MVKKNKNKQTLGRSLIRDHLSTNKGKKHVSDKSMLHTTEVQDGYDWGRLNLQSVTEESSFQDFLATAELAGTEFQAEKLNVKLINPRSNVGLLNADERREAQKNHEKFQEIIRIPRKPQWDSNTTPEELDRNEKEYFLEWRRSLAILQEEQDLILTPYERNLEFWRQLWRVVERSDVVVQIVDARNPLLFYCEDLESYVHEVSTEKMNLILINKADFLNETQRQHWAEYFDGKQTRIVFYSALTPEENDIRTKINELEEKIEETSENLRNILQLIEGTSIPRNSTKILTREELIEFFKTIHHGEKHTPNLTTIGLVGYPNVGKSSTINSLLMSKKVSVSATPGKTKHFQTHFLDQELMLCDCPGLVMPAFVFTKAEMIINGILPIDQMRDHVPPINLVANLIPRHIFESKYGIMIPRPVEGEDPDRSPTSQELLDSYAYNRGFMTANGQPDNARAARYILKDFMNGKLLYCHAPSGVDQKSYHQWEAAKNIATTNHVLPPQLIRATRAKKTTGEDFDKAFFQTNNGGVHMKPINNSMLNGDVEKPWKKQNKRSKKEKLRRIYAHLDQH